MNSVVCPRNSEQIEKCFAAQFDILKDASQQPRREVFAPMHGYHGCTPIGVSQIEVATLLADTLKTDVL